MSIEIITPRHVVTVTERRLAFDRLDDPNSGFWFEIDENMVPVLDTEARKESYTYCSSHPEIYSGPYLTSWVRHYTEPAIGKCFCGAQIVLRDEYCGACQCQECERWYDLQGHILRPPEEWEEDY